MILKIWMGGAGLNAQVVRVAHAELHRSLQKAEAEVGGLSLEQETRSSNKWWAVNEGGADTLT